MNEKKSKIDDIEYEKKRQDVVDYICEKRRIIREIPLGMFKRFLKDMHGLEGVCVWCGKKLDKKRNTTCSAFCWAMYHSHYYRPDIRHRLIRERGSKCEACGIDCIPDMHHIIPISYFGDPFNEDNLILLCKKCHNQAHQHINAEEKLMKNTPKLQTYLSDLIEKERANETNENNFVI